MKEEPQYHFVEEEPFIVGKVPNFHDGIEGTLADMCYSAGYMGTENVADQ